MTRFLRLAFLTILAIAFVPGLGSCEEMKLTYDTLTEDIAGANPEFPKYTTQLINLANRNAHATRPRYVGQMSELIQEFDGDGYDDWVRWYTTKHPQAIEHASDKIYAMLQKIKVALDSIDKPMVEKWTRDLVLTKTYVGLYAQKSILKNIAEEKGTTYRLATPNEESRGIDGYIGDKAVSVKPMSYKSKPELQEKIEAELIFYEKVRGGIKVHYDF